jgi:hypothetical protein
MDNPKADSRRADRGRIIDVLASMALGDASREDVLAELNGHRHQSAGAALELLTRERKSRRHHRHEEHHSRGPHPIPKIPFILNGTLYDPADISRFNGRELHLVQTKGDYMIGIDDRRLVQMWWDLVRAQAFIEALKKKVEGIAGIHFYPSGTGKAAPEDGPIKAGGFGGYGGGGVVPQSGSSVPGESGGSVVIIGGGTFPQDYALLYEDANFQGDWLNLESHHSYPRLEAVGRGFLQLGDWNDVISSVKFLQVSTCILFENEYFGELDGGSSLTLSASESSLDRLGWNDRASSVDVF